MEKKGAPVDLPACRGAPGDGKNQFAIPFLLVLVGRNYWKTNFSAQSVL
jgi:hypothetical protein